MRVGDLREFDGGESVISVGADLSVGEATKVMATSKIGAVLVLEGGQVAGIFTERDVMARVVALDRDTHTTPVRDVMTGDVKTVKIDDAAIDCLEMMAEGRFRHLPVVDDAGRPIGMLSQRDFVATTLPKALALAGQTARATVSKRYQPVVIIASVVAYTVVIIAAVSFFV